MSNSGMLISPILINLPQSREGMHRAQGRTAITELIMDPKRVGQSEWAREREIAKRMRALAGITRNLRTAVSWSKWDISGILTIQKTLTVPLQFDTDCGRWIWFKSTELFLSDQINAAIRCPLQGQHDRPQAYWAKAQKTHHLNMTSGGPTHKQTAHKRSERNCEGDSGPTPGPLVERSWIQRQ